jgi:RNA polymerase sigma-70 factor (ECF subfamily)
MPDDEDLIDRLRAGDEAAFAELVSRYHLRLVGLARTFVATREAAEDVAQETWLAAVRGIDRFEGRSLLHTWLFQICVNRARTRGILDRQLVSSSRIEPTSGATPVRSDRARIDTSEHWSERVDDRLLAAGLAEEIQTAISHLPRAQRLVVTLRDIDGLTGEEVCAAMSITDANQRVLLHRARSTLRRRLIDVLERTP